MLRWLAAVSLCVFGPLGAAAQQAAPLVLEGDSALSYDAQAYFDLPREGTIEVWVAALWDADPGYDPCVLSSASASPGGTGGATHYGVYITADRQAVGLYDGQRLATVPFDFTDGAYHHVALVTKGPRTQVTIDGSAVGTINLGYGKARGQPFSVGSSNGTADYFIGAVWALRIWNRALTKVALEELASDVGPPAADHPFASALVAHSNFTDAGIDVTIPALAAAAEVAAEEPPAEEEAPAMEAGPDFSGIWVVRNSRVFEKDELDDVDGDKHWKFVTYPVYMVETGEGKAASRATGLVGARGGREFSDTVPQGGALTEIAVGHSEDGIDHIKAAGRNGRGSALNFRRHGARRRRPVSRPSDWRRASSSGASREPTTARSARSSSTRTSGARSCSASRPVARPIRSRSRRTASSPGSPGVPRGACTRSVSSTRRSSHPSS